MSTVSTVVTARHYRPGDTNALHRPGDKVVNMQSVLMMNGSFIRTLEIDDEVIAVFGLVLRWPGVADIWAIVGDKTRGHGLGFTRKVKALMRQFADELSLWRIGATVREDLVEYQAWLELLGFEKEGVESQAAPDGSNLIRYRWLRWTCSGAGAVTTLQ